MKVLMPTRLVWVKSASADPVSWVNMHSPSLALVERKRRRTAPLLLERMVDEGRSQIGGIGK
jgi:hypothetical protein